MNASIRVALAALRMKPLAASFTTIFALAAADATATTWQVTTCADSGPGSLRSVVGDPAVVSNDIVDMSSLSCSAISLTTGAITINQHNLTLQGPGADKLQIFAPTVVDSVINHQGSGTLFIDRLYVSKGNGHLTPYGTIAGGCIYSAGNVNLSHSTIYGCQAYAPAAGGHFGEGGGIFTVGNLVMTNSAIVGNYAGASQSGSAGATGGGAWVGGNFIAKYSTISDNRLRGPGSHARGGGLFVTGANTTIVSSTVARNFSSYEGGGVVIFPLVIGATSATISNSTISGNTAPKIGGLYSNISTTIRNSTIAFNHKQAPSGNSAGVTFAAATGPIIVTLQSNLIANNTYIAFGSTQNNDLSTIAPSASNTVTINGAKNLIRVPDSSVIAKLPADTITGQCPLLGTLRDNGGATFTHALLSHSRGINEGNNSASLDYDQRNGPLQTPPAMPPTGYPRVSGTSADVGAYELQEGDIIFDNSFDGCP
jgi:hypothetical protein